MTPQVDDTRQHPALTVYRGWKDTGKHVWSPFVVKLEARLRFGNLAYRTAVGSPKTAPRGKIPYVEFTSAASGDAALGDSDLIIKALMEREFLSDLNARLDGEDRGWERWTQNYYTMRDHIFGAMPWPLRVAIGLLAYRGTVATLHGQGTGRYAAEEIAAFRLEIWEASSPRDDGPTEEKEPFWVLGGEEPTEADATVFGFVGTGFAGGGQGVPGRREYAERIQNQYFPDYEKWTL
ncbi:hypothetical protein PG994_005281 [Apiospora phragmitis]|uniref:Thioredoxin-like fold domain-containing protein n=1 Tax=Apiospora phragmitis TaxID=2905665 RepID=A0ABR1VBS6_9PEZI